MFVVPDRKQCAIISELISSFPKYMPFSKDIIIDGTTIAAMKPSKEKKIDAGSGIGDFAIDMPFVSARANSAYMLLSIYDKDFLNGVEALWSDSSSPGHNTYNAYVAAPAPPSPLSKGSASQNRKKRLGDTFTTSNVIGVLEVMTSLSSSSNIGGLTIVFDPTAKSDEWSSSDSKWAPPPIEAAAEFELEQLLEVFKQFITIREKFSQSKNKSLKFSVVQSDYDGKGHWSVRDRVSGHNGTMYVPNNFLRGSNHAREVIDMIGRWSWEWIQE